MLVVADSTPLIALADIGNISVLPALFGQVIIPAEVSLELRGYKRSEAVRDLLVAPPVWLLERAPTCSSQLRGFTPGSRRRSISPWN
jgi:hypothetical protein